MNSPVRLHGQLQFLCCNSTGKHAQTDRRYGDKESHRSFRSPIMENWLLWKQYLM